MLKARLRAGLLLPILACGGNSVPQGQQTNLALPTASATAAPPAFDLSPVPTPSSLILVARFLRPAKMPGVVSSWTGFPIPVGEVLDEAFGDKVSAVIDMSQPIDFAIAMEQRARGSSRPTWSVSAGVRTMDDAKNALSTSFTLAPLANGALRLVPQKRKEIRCQDDEDCDDEPRVTRSCVLTPAYGTAMARIVCGRSGVDALYPYLTRSVTRIDAPSDVHAEIYADGIRTALGERWIARDIQRIGAAGMDLMDFAGDVDKVVIDAKVDDPAASASAVVSFKRTQSPITRALLAHADKAGPPPAAFAKLPADADAAFFESGIDAKELDHAKQLAAEALDKALGEENMASADRKAITDAARSFMALAEAPLVWAKGTDIMAAQAAIAAAKGSKASPAATVAKLGGWSIIGVELPIAKVAPVAKEWAGVVARPGISKWMQTQVGRDTPPPTFKGAAVPKGLPADTQHFELSMPTTDWTPPPPIAPTGGAKPAPANKPVVIVHKIQLYLVPEGGRTWLVWSLDDGIAQDKAKAVLAGTGPTLGSRAGLDDLRAARSNAGGFLTMRALVLDSPLVVATHAPARYLERPDPLFGMTTSNAGTNPVAFSIASAANQTVSANLRVSREAIRDGIVLSRALRW